ncbi:MAG: hypothetical protein WAO21_08110 [Verrucomicrobiia bacterium]
MAGKTGKRLQQQLAHLRKSEDFHLKVWKKMMDADGGALFPVDLLANAVLHRSINLVRGYATLVEQRNWICAAPLLRLQLDNCLRFYAVFIVEKPHDFAMKVFEGVAIRKMKDRTGNLMKDAYLVEKLSQQHPWVARVYERTSGYIHLSDTHIFNTFAPTSPEEHNKKLQNIAVGVGDSFETDEVYEEATLAFIEATKVLFKYIIGWVNTKETRRVASSKKVNG